MDATTPWGTVSAACFKTHCLRLLDEVERTRRPLLVTKRGRAVAQVVPTAAPPRSIFGSMRGTGVVRGDIVAPLGETWNAGHCRSRPVPARAPGSH